MNCQYWGRTSAKSLKLLAVLATWTVICPASTWAEEPAARQPVAAAASNPYPGRFPAPSLEGGTEWLNTSGPISLQDLRGKIVLLDFWTYCCINCMHILPDLKYLEKKYPNQLVVIGVHSAKFENEKESENIREAIMRYEIEHPVINDSKMVIARKYDFSSWPTLVLIDPQGNVVGRQPGEGTRDLFDQVIDKMVTYHRANKTLDETPVHFNLERAKAEETPLRYPGKILADEAGGRLFITDSNHNRIVVTSLTGELQSIIGSGAIGAQDGPIDQASFDHPQGVALVGDQLYVADTENHLLRKVDLKAGLVSTIAGTGVQSHARPPLGAALNMKKTPLNSPWALQELKGMLYVAMAGPHQIWRHKIGTEMITPFIGSGREDILDGTLHEAALAQPSDIVTDGTVLYHVDSEGSAIRRDELGTKGGVFTVVGPHDFPQGRSLFEFGDNDGHADAVRMQHPIGLAYHDRSLYVADTYNDKIKKVDLEKQNAVTWLGTGERGKGLDPVELNEPAGLTIAAGKLFIADTNNHRILVSDLQTKATQELVIAGLTAPKPSASTAEEKFVGDTSAASSVTVAAGQPASIRVTFELPRNHELNDQAPVIYQFNAAPGVALLDSEAIGKRKRAEKTSTTATIPLPLSGNLGTGEITLTISYQFCTHGKSGLCRFGSQQWTIPLSVAEQGGSEIRLTAKPTNVPAAAAGDLIGD